MTLAQTHASDPLRGTFGFGGGASVAVAALCAFGIVASAEASAQEPGSQRFGIVAAKVLTAAADGPQVIDYGLVVVEDGRIVEVRTLRGSPAPEGLELIDVGDRWLMPGMIDLHSHIGGTFDINGAVYQSNPGLRVSTAVIPGNGSLDVALAAGVTTSLFIPGSATTVGGQGILIKSHEGSYEDVVVRDPGSLKVAQADNPRRWGYGMNRIFLNWTIRNTMRRGVGYARRWEAFEGGTGERPLVDPQFEVFRALVAGETQVSAHTQVAQVVASSIRIMTIEFGIPLYIDHGSFDGFKVAGMAIENNVPAILGPRNFSSENKGRGIDHDGRILGIAAEYQARGHRMIGFNTDAPVIPGHELALQAGIAVRFGLIDTGAETVRGLTIVPAMAAGIDDRVGSLELGKDADILVLDGPPGDPRTSITTVFIEGVSVYDAERDGRRF